MTLHTYNSFINNQEIKCLSLVNVLSAKCHGTISLINCAYLFLSQFIVNVLSGNFSSVLFLKKLKHMFVNIRRWLIFIRLPTCFFCIPKSTPKYPSHGNVVVQFRFSAIIFSYNICKTLYDVRCFKSRQGLIGSVVLAKRNMTHDSLDYLMKHNYNK